MFNVNQIIRCKKARGGFQVWMIVSINLGGTNQESTIGLRSLDVKHPTSGEFSSIPVRMLELLIENEIAELI